MEDIYNSFAGFNPFKDFDFFGTSKLDQPQQQSARTAPPVMYEVPPNYRPAEQQLMSVVGAAVPGAAPAYHAVRTAGATAQAALEGNALEDLMQRLRAVESTHNYAADRAIKSRGKETASGAYQYTDGTWGNYAGYPRAVMAPPEVQDRRMMEDLQRRYARYGNPYQTVAEHFLPAYARTPERWNVPIHGQGTMQQYVSKVLGDENVRRYLDAVGR
jgi:hypothetical protein